MTGKKSQSVAGSSTQPDVTGKSYGKNSQSMAEKIPPKKSKSGELEWRRAWGYFEVFPGALVDVRPGERIQRALRHTRLTATLPVGASADYQAYVDQLLQRRGERFGVHLAPLGHHLDSARQVAIIPPVVVPPKLDQDGNRLGA